MTVCDGIESRVDAEERVEAPDQQARADEEHQRQRHFDNDERTSRAGASCGRASASAFLQRVGQRRARGGQSREQAERERR